MEELKPVVFLDRDGVLCKEKSYVKSPGDLEIFPFARKAVELIKKSGYVPVVITNQSGVARGYFSEAALVKMNTLLQQETQVDAIYYCPHYPPGENEREEKPYRIVCQCRKPNRGLMDKAAKELDLDLGRAFFVGDRASDIQAGEQIGAVTVLLESGYGSERLERSVKPDLKFNDLMAFAQYLYHNTSGEKGNAL